MWHLCFSKWEIIQDIFIKLFSDLFTSILTVLLFLNLSVSQFSILKTLFLLYFHCFSCWEPSFLSGAVDSLWRHVTAYDGICDGIWWCQRWWERGGGGDSVSPKDHKRSQNFFRDQITELETYLCKRWTVLSVFDKMNGVKRE